MNTIVAALTARGTVYDVYTRKPYNGPDRTYVGPWAADTQIAYAVRESDNRWSLWTLNGEVVEGDLCNRLHVKAMARRHWGQFVIM
ncbi:hypothetical protein [Streptomyces smyrnaeus]|uniref:hypothetical protein n=1 Tax=Streptomyces smyrnaeus TaxID=1387713 RepID=UPI0036AC6BE8